MPEKKLTQKEMRALEARALLEKQAQLEQWHSAAVAQGLSKTKPHK